MIRIVALFTAATLMAGCTTTQLAEAQEVCQAETSTGPLVITLLDVNGVPISTANKVAEVIAADCAVIDAIPAPAGAVPTTSIVVPSKSPA